MSLNTSVSVLQADLPGIEIFGQDSPMYEAHTIPWSLADFELPVAVIAPRDEAQLQQVVRYICDRNLDFALRGTGCGSSSAKDVIVCMQRFTDLQYDPRTRTVLVGAGLTTADVDRALQKQATGQVAVLARCPYVGVTGSILTGGLSWLSHEFGLGSDPTNLLDVRIILQDGRALWASEEPDLLWALRGGGGNFGAVSQLRLQTHTYENKIWSGMVHVPSDPDTLHKVSHAVSVFAKKKDAKMALHVFIVDFTMQALQGQPPVPQLALLPFDAHGEAHARTSDGFAWLLEVPGAQCQCGEMDIAAVNELQRPSEHNHGKAQSWLSAALVPEIDAGLVIRAWSWYKEFVTQRPEFGLGTFVLLEIMQEPAFLASGSAESTAWPHAALGRQHVLQLSAGCVPSPTERTARSAMAREILTAALEKISGREQPPGHYLPNFALPWNNIAAMFGPNWGRVCEIKRRYDPHNRFNKGLKLV